MKNTIAINARYLLNVYKLLTAYTFSFTVSDIGAERVYIDFETDGILNVKQFTQEIKMMDFLRRYDSFDLTVHDGNGWKFFVIANYNAYHDECATLIDIEDI